MTQVPTPNAPQSLLPPAPPALQPAYPVGGLNSNIVLFDGELELEQGDNRLREKGTIQFKWFPSPCITFCLRETSTQVFFNFEDNAVLRLGDGRMIPSARITHLPMAHHDGRLSQNPSGRVEFPASQETAFPFSYLTFLLPNFPDMMGEGILYPSGVWRAGRIKLCACGWQVTIDQIEHSSDVRREAKQQSGYVVTHVGRLEREDGSTFTEKHACSILEGLGWYLSFATGRWTGPLLACGYDGSDTRVREMWNMPRMSPWRFVQTWLDTNHREHLIDSFPGYLQRWTDQDWQEVTELATHWYIEANAQAGSIEGSLVLAQAAFEMLASAIVVEEKEWVSADAFEKLPAADRIRLLFVWAGVPLSIPASQPELTALAKELNWTDAPQALTEIRNPLTHPTPKNRKRFRNYPPAARSEAWNLALWFLEMCLLRMCDYNGTYGCRLAMRYVGNVDPVPWKTT
jgi:hypothetical protein